MTGRRALAGLAVVAAAALLVAPEIPRYRAERRIGFATAALRGFLDRASDPQVAANILGVGEVALGATKGLPGDPRPWIIVGSAFLVTGQPDRALENYREAFATGERAEIDLNLGRAYALARRKTNAEDALVRAGWVSPEILASLPEGAREPLRARVDALAADLVAGRISAPPPLPEPERR